MPSPVFDLWHGPVRSVHISKPNTTRLLCGGGGRGFARVPNFQRVDLSRFWAYCRVVDFPPCRSCAFAALKGSH
jgi:hypothetical protein